MCYLIENFEYGLREFAIYDNNGDPLQFGKELAQTDQELWGWSKKKSVNFLNTNAQERRFLFRLL